MVATFTTPMIVKTPPPARSEQTAASQDPLAGLADIQDVLDLVRNNYVEAPEMDKVVGGGIQAALERVHPLNALLTQEDLRLPDPGPADPGLRLLKRGIYAQVISVLGGSPAAKAGFRVGDVIRKIDGQSIATMSQWTLERRLRGPEGSEVNLTRSLYATGETKQTGLTRIKPEMPPVVLRKSDTVAVLVVPDLLPGRVAEIRRQIEGLDRALTLILDFRECAGGTLQEAAAVGGLFLGEGTLATIQEAGKPDVTVSITPGKLAPFAALAFLLGPWTIGPAEALASAMKRQDVPTFGDRTYGLGVERLRFHLRQGGAVELVARRWIGAGGEKLGGTSGPGPDRPGVAAMHVMRGLKPDEDPVPRVLELLKAPKPKPEAVAAPAPGKGAVPVARNRKAPA